MSKNFSHLDYNDSPNMVDISFKENSKRIARASGVVNINRKTLELISNNKIRKGNVLQVANIAGIQAAKKTHELIPLCHSLSLSYVKLDFKICMKENLLEINSEVSTIGKTGVEMEALTAVSSAALAIYDMCKSVDKKIIISDIKLKYKSGGKSGIFNA